LLLVAALLATCSPLRNIPASVPALDAGQQPGVLASKRSAAFVPNPELTNPVFLFRTLGSVGTLFFGRHEVAFPLPSPDDVATWFSGLSEAGPSDLATSAEPATLRLQFVGGNPDTHVVGEEQLPGIVNYFIGNDPTKWHTNIPTYGSIVYERLYPGIDLIYSGGEDFLKGTFVVAPGANPDDIRWRYDGASRVELSQGELLIHVAEDDKAASLIEREPVAWQTVAGKRNPVDARYVVRGDGSIGFALGRYDTAQPLIIDPTLDYSTYFGGSGFDGSGGIAVDCNDHVYIAGATDSPNFPPPDPTPLAGDLDLFVTKLDRSKTGAEQLIYTTYVGGADRESVLGIEVDCSGRAYVVGYTGSDDLPTTANAFQPDFSADVDGMVVQLDAAGAIHYVSYLGGTNFEELVQIAVGENGLMHVVGFTGSTDFPTTDDAFQQAKVGAVGEFDALMAVLDPSKSGAASLVYSTYYGGAEADEGYAIDVSSDGIIYFAGHSASDDLVLENSIQDYQGGGWSGDAFLVKLDSSQSGNDQLLFATYLGGTGGEISGGIAVDSSGDVVWGGLTASANFTTTAISPPYGGGDDWGDAFLVKVDTTTPSLIYSRFVGGSGDDAIRHVVVDGSGNAYVTGGTGSDNFPTVNPIQDTYQGGVASVVELSWYGPGDAIVAKFDPTGAMTFGTYLSGAGVETGMGIVLDTLGNVYVAGGTESANLVTVDPFQDASAGGFDVFIAQIGGLAPATIAVTKTASVDTANVGQTITYTYRVTNTSGVTLSMVSAVDDRLGAVALDSTNLAPGTGTGGTLTYIVVEGDLPGPLTNTVTVTGTPPVGDDVIDTADESVALTSNPSITVTKTASASSVEVGEVITYTYWVTNTGDVTLNSVAAHDDELGPVTLGATSLAPNAGTSGALTYVVVEGDLPGPLANTVTVTGTPSVGDDVTATADESVTLTSSPVIAVTKLANASSAKVGETITYTYQVTNIGNVTLDSVAAYDDKLGPVTLGATTLAPDAETGGTLTYVVIEDDLPGPLTNNVTVTGTPPVGDDVTETADESVTLISGASITVTKRANVDSAEVGESINYTYWVTNTGDVTLNSVEARDDKLGPVTLGATTLAPGAGTSGALAHVVAEDDLPSPLENTVTVTGTPSVGDPAIDTADESVDLTSSPSIVVTKIADVSSAEVGERIVYTYWVTNTGNVTLNSVAAHDDKLGAVTLSATTLAPDEGTNGTLAYTVVEGDLPGPLANTVTATGAPPVGVDVQDTADESVALTSSPAITVTKIANASSAAVGEMITYTYWVTNTGNVMLGSIAAYDDKLGAVTLGATTLTPDAGTSGTLAYVVVEGDLPGPLANTVTVTGTPPVGDDVVATADESVALTSSSAITVTKTANVNSARVGKTITYTYRVTNTGNVMLDSVMAYDDRLGLVELGATSLLPGVGASGTLTYTVIEGDMPGPLTNTVTVTGTPTLGLPVTAKAGFVLTLGEPWEIIYLPLVLSSVEGLAVKGPTVRWVKVHRPF